MSSPFRVSSSKLCLHVKKSISKNKCDVEKNFFCRKLRRRLTWIWIFSSSTSILSTAPVAENRLDRNIREEWHWRGCEPLDLALRLFQSLYLFIKNSQNRGQTRKNVFVLLICSVFDYSATAPPWLEVKLCETRIFLEYFVGYQQPEYYQTANRCKHIVRWRYQSWIKIAFFWCAKSKTEWSKMGQAIISDQ